MSQKDGTGAQVQRYASVFAAASLIKTNFKHKGLAKIDVNPGDSFSSTRDVDEFIRKLNQILSETFQKSVQEENTFAKELKFAKDSNLFYLSALLFSFVSYFTKKSFLLEVENCYRICGLYPESFRTFGDKFQVKVNSLSEKSFQSSLVNFHIRAFNLGTSNHVSSLSTDRLISVCESILKKFDNFNFNIHTDVNPSNTQLDLINSETSKETLMYWQSFGFDYSERGFEVLENEVKKVLIMFQNHGIQSSIITGINPLEFWKSTINSKIFVMAHSSLSFITAISMRDAVIYVPKSWPFKLEAWIEY